MDGNINILKTIERIRGISKEKKQVNGAEESRKATEYLQKKNESGQKESLSKRCKKCDDTTWVLVSVDGRRCARRCECSAETEVHRNGGWERAGFTSKSSNLNFTTFKTYNGQTEAIKNMAIKYYKYFSKLKDKRKNSIIFCGNPGSGKTHLSIAIANNLMKKKIKVVYMPYRDIITSIKQNILDVDKYSKYINKYKEAEVLLIDDLFKGNTSKSDINIMFEIINYRYMNNLPLIISTELIVEEIIEIDEAIGSRIYEMSSDYTIEILGRQNNYRLK